ncbi:hypothetical protein ACH5RR_033141 [Cinchona calisaya]|uniref:Uncharacterized protein n=1 Tax=Cinchona calisaya TaxID=153742 RepID=A0ABD2YP93_9GENT
MGFKILACGDDLMVRIGVIGFIFLLFVVKVKPMDVCVEFKGFEWFNNQEKSKKFAKFVAENSQTTLRNFRKLVISQRRNIEIVHRLLRWKLDSQPSKRYKDVVLFLSILTAVRP